MESRKRHVSEWRPFSELNSIKQNISDWRYPKEYIKKRNLEETRFIQGFHPQTGVMFCFEPIEIKAFGEEIIWRENENHVHMDVPDTFETQFGTLINHNNGEFSSWLSKDIGGKDWEIQRNYRDMFDCGDYSYAISNLGPLMFKIIRINSKIEDETVFICKSNREMLEYAGRFQKGSDHYIVASGYYRVDSDGKRSNNDKTFLFRVRQNGEFIIQNEWNLLISPVNSIAVAGDDVYFGQNKMVTKLNITSGTVEYYTNKSDDELDEIVYDIG